MNFTTAYRHSQITIPSHHRLVNNKQTTHKYQHRPVRFLRIPLFSYPNSFIEYPDGSFDLDSSLKHAGMSVLEH